MKLECAAIAIFSQPLLQSTYILDGDSCSGFVTYDAIIDSHAWIRDHMPALSFPGLRGAIDEWVQILWAIPGNGYIPNDEPRQEATKIVVEEIRQLLPHLPDAVFAGHRHPAKRNQICIRLNNSLYKVVNREYAT